MRLLDNADNFELFGSWVSHASSPPADPSRSTDPCHKHDGILLGDSSGFQIDKNTLDGLKGFRAGMSADEAVEAWNDAYAGKLWIISWLESYCTFAMTIDIPLTGTMMGRNT